MEKLQGLLLAAAFAVAFLAVLRWIFGGARERGAHGSARVPRPTAPWGHVGVRRRDLASTGNWQIRIR
jgi:hypothetical protein